MTQREIEAAGMPFHPVERVVIGVVIGCVSVYVAVGLIMMLVR